MMLCFSSSLHCSSQRNPDVLSAGQVKLDEDALRAWNAAFPVTHLRLSFQGDVPNEVVDLFPFFWILVWLDTFKLMEPSQLD